MIIIGAILLILGLIFAVPLLWTIGIVVIAIGLIMLILGAAGRTLAGRRYWY